MRRTLFPDLEKEPDTKSLIGLKIVEITETLHGSVKRILCEDSVGETHVITFRPVDSSGIAINLDGHVVLNIETEVR